MWRSENMDAIFQRRSIRKFKDEPINEEQLKTLLKAAMAAPNAFESNEWEFVVVQSEEGKKKIIAAQPYARAAENAAAIIIVCGNTKLEKNEPVLVQNCCAAIENILICATALNLGSLWLGAGGETITKLRQAFGIPEYVLPVGMVAVGHAAQVKPAHDRYFAEKVHFERFSRSATSLT